MNKKRLVIIVLAISIIMTVSVIGIYARSPRKDNKTELLAVIDMLEGFSEGYCNNPNMGDPVANDLFQVPNNYEVAVIAVRLTWDDDHHDADSQDLYDTFTLAITTKNESNADSNNEGELILGIGMGNINMNAQSMDDLIIENFRPLGNQCDFTVTISDCGSYPLIRPNGFLRSDDQGNHWFLEIQVLVVEYVEGK